MDMESDLLQAGGTGLRQDSLAPLNTNTLDVAKQIYTKSLNYERQENELDLVLWRLKNMIQNEESEANYDVESSFHKWKTKFHIEQKNKYLAGFRKMTRLHKRRLSDINADADFYMVRAQADPRMLNYAEYWKSLLLKTQAETRRKILKQLKSTFKTTENQR